MRTTWETRFEWIESILQWTALVLGVGLAVLGDVNLLTGEISAATITASIAVAAYTVLMQVLPSNRKQLPFVGAFLAALGVAISLFAISLTGGTGSPFLLYLAVPIFFAATTQGVVLGAITALAAIVGLALVARNAGEDLMDPRFLQMVAFYALVGITFAQAYRILIEEPETRRPEASLAEQAARLEEAHRLLAELADLATTDDLSPITIGRSALRDVAANVPYASGSVSIVESSGETVVATRGQAPAGAAGTGYPIDFDGRRLGTLTLWPMAGAELALHRKRIERALRPVALAFDNVVLLQTIAHRSVREERIRVARELHDEIGPLLVSVGLGLDVAIQSDEIDEKTAAHLAGLRENVGKLVDDVRRTVTVLRSTKATTVTEHAHNLAADVDSSGPSIIVDIDEEGVLGEREIAQLAAIMTEAVRNALEHARARVVRIEGKVDRDRVLLRITDDGNGFDPELEPEGRYGLVGMRERAREIGANLTVDSSEGRGTVVTVAWDVG